MANTANNVGGQLGGQPGGVPGGSVVPLPAMVTTAPPIPTAAEKAKQQETLAYLQKVATGAEAPETVNIRLVQRGTGWAFSAQGRSGFRSVGETSDRLTRAEAERWALRDTTRNLNLSSDDTILINQKVVQSPTIAPDVLAAAQQIRTGYTTYEAQLERAKAEERAYLGDLSGFQAKDVARLQAIEAKTAGMSPTQAAEFLKGELKGYYGKDVLAGVRYTVGDRSFSDPKLAEQYAAQVAKETKLPGEYGYHATPSRPGGMWEGALPQNVLPTNVLKPVFVEGKPNIELFQQAKAQSPETFYHPKYGLMTRQALPSNVLQPVFEGMKPYRGLSREQVFTTYLENVITGTKNIYGMIGEKAREGVISVTPPGSIRRGFGIMGADIVTGTPMIASGGLLLPSAIISSYKSGIFKPKLFSALQAMPTVIISPITAIREAPTVREKIGMGAGLVGSYLIGTEAFKGITPLRVIKTGESFIKAEQPRFRRFLASEETPLFGGKGVKLTTLKTTYLEQINKPIIQAYQMAKGFNVPDITRVKSVSDVIRLKETKARLEQESTWRPLSPEFYQERAAGMSYLDDLMIQRAKIQARAVKAAGAVSKQEALGQILGVQLQVPLQVFKPILRKRFAKIGEESRSGYLQLVEEELSYIREQESPKSIYGGGYHLQHGDIISNKYVEDYLSDIARKQAARPQKRLIPFVITSDILKPHIKPIESPKTKPITRSKYFSGTPYGVKLFEYSYIETPVLPRVRTPLGLSTSQPTALKLKTSQSEITRIMPFTSYKPSYDRPLIPEKPTIKYHPVLHGTPLEFFTRRKRKVATKARKGIVLAPVKHPLSDIMFRQPTKPKKSGSLLFSVLNPQKKKKRRHKK